MDVKKASELASSVAVSGTISTRTLTEYVQLATAISKVLHIILRLLTIATSLVQSVAGAGVTNARCSSEAPIARRREYAQLEVATIRLGAGTTRSSIRAELLANGDIASSVSV